MHIIKLLSTYRGNYGRLPTGFKDEFVTLHNRRLVEVTIVTSEDLSVGSVDVVRTVIRRVPQTLRQPVFVIVKWHGSVQPRWPVLECCLRSIAFIYQTSIIYEVEKNR